jgi:hypothetical protein
MTAMKARRFIVFFVVLAVPLLAQDFQPLPAPPAEVGVPFYLDTTAGELKKLAMEPYKEHNNAGPITTLSGVTKSVQMEGASSSFRIPSHDKIVFVFDATTFPKLYKFEVHGKKREFPYSKVSKHDSTAIDGISISVSRYKDTAYQFSTDQPLAPGEYAIVFADRIYTFGVDDKK